jgi:HTH-type transcriptional regulator / antitoxin HigA
MTRLRDKRRVKLPGRFADLVRTMPPRAIVDDAQHKTTVEMVDVLMRSGKLTKDQAAYMETLVQLVQAYEASHHAINATGLRGIDTLAHLLAESGMNASDLARLLGIHASMGSKILKGERSLTVDHLKKLAAHFKVRPEIFMD